MTDWKTVTLDDASMWPTGPVVELPDAHADDRGAIQPLVDLPMKNVSLITSRKGSLRSNHYHLHDWHYIYVLSGSLEYHFRPAGSSENPRLISVGVGQMIFTAPLVEHATVFREDTQLLVASRNSRDQEIYEADVVRVLLVDPSHAT